MAYEVGGVSFDLGVNLKNFEKQLDKAFGIAKKKGAGLVWDTSSFVAGLKMTKKEFKSFSDEVSKARDKYEELLDLQKGLQSSDLWSKMGDQARSAVEDAVSMAKAEADLYKRTQRFMGLGRGIRSIFGGLGKLFGGLFSSFRQNTAKAGVEFSSFLKRLVGIASVAVLLRKAFSYAREGMQNLMKADATTANSVMTLRNALTALKNALASAFAPILNVIAPILAKFIGMLTAAANAIASFLSALTGRKFAVVASGVADGFDGIGGSASGANDSAKELQRTLMGFDKINKLDSSSGGGSGGGGGGGGGAGGGGFDLVPISDEVNAWADKFKESWENADFTWLGKLLAEKLNSALAKIPWEEINATLEKIAKSIGTFLNGFIENFDWGLLGKTIGEGIKAALNFVNTFLETVHWEAIGKAIVDFLTGIDWVGIFKAATKLVTNIANALWGVIKGAFEEAKGKISEWLKTHDIWEGLADIGDVSANVLVKLDLYNSLPEWAQKIIDFAVKNNPMSLTLDVVTSLGQGISDLWSLLTGGNNQDANIKVNLQKGSWNSDAYNASKVGGGTVNRTLKQSTKKGKWNKDAYKASQISGGTVNRTLQISTALKKGSKTLSQLAAAVVGRAKGGVYKNGRWSAIQRYASGGLPNGSQLFWAREKGPELVGTLGGHTAVMNNDQIVASVSSGVAKAIAGIKFQMSAPALANAGSASMVTSTAWESFDNQQVVVLLTQILKALNEKDNNVYLDGEQIKNNIVRRINNHTRATGQLELII